LFASNSAKASAGEILASPRYDFNVDIFSNNSRYFNLGLNQTAISQLLKVSRVSVSKFLKRYPIENGEYTR
jgi:hypothetical protein